MGNPFVFTDRWFAGETSPTVIVFTGAHMPPPLDLAAAMQSSIAEPHVEKVVVVAPAYLREELFTLLEDDAIHERLPNRLLHKNALLGVIVSEAGMCTMFNLDGETIQIAAGFEDKLRDAGMRHIFHKHDVLLDGKGRFHFRKPSQAHSSQFIRISAALVETAEVDFIALWLLKYIPIECGAILCDTASITAIPYAALTLARRFGRQLPVSLEVGTFHSFKFINDKNSILRPDAIFLISVTTAARLERQMIEKGVHREQLITIYGVCNECQAVVLCNLNSGRVPVPRITNYWQDNCPECLAGTPLVNVVGDDFLAIVTEVESVMPVASDAPLWLNQFMEDASGRGVIRCNYGEGPLDNIHDVYLDVRRLFNSELWRDVFDRHLSQAIPSSLQVVYYVDDHGGEEMAKEVRQRYFDWTGKDVDVTRMTADSIAQCPQSGSVLVICSATAGGRQITAASQLLREVRPKGEVVFLIGLLRLPTTEEAKRLRSNLIFTPDRRFRFVLHVIEEIEFPDNTRTRPSLWVEEAKILKGFKLEASEIPVAVAEVINRRIAEIEQSVSTEIRGLVNEVFWTTVNSIKLELRPNFSLFNFQYDQISQAEVFFAISALLHRMRIGGRAAKLTQSPFLRTVIDPLAFNRFSDGVVQAALLRAALPVELDYSFELTVSACMKPVLDNILANCEKPAGEAANEFLYSLYTGRLKIAGVHLRSILKRHIRRRPIDSFDVFLAKKILNKYGFPWDE